MTTESEFENLAVLVVDDNVFVRDLLKRLLRGFGITAVREAENGVTALEFLSGARVDLVICDIQMDGMDGIEFLRMLRSGRKRAGGGEVTTSPSVPVILVTAHAEASVIDRARKAGANGFLVKPIAPKVLLERIRWVLGRK